MNSMASIHLAAGRGNINRVRNLLNQGTNVNTRNTIDFTPLHWAAEAGHMNIVRLLLSRGASVNARSPIGETPLHWAAFQGNVNIVHELLRHGAHVNARDNQGRTPLHWAVYARHPRVARMLVEAGAKLSYRNVLFGRTPLNAALNNQSRSALGARAVEKWQTLRKKRLARNRAPLKNIAEKVFSPNRVRSMTQKYIESKNNNNFPNWLKHF